MAAPKVTITLVSVAGCRLLVVGGLCWLSPVLRTDSEPARSTRLSEADRTAPSSTERDSMVKRKIACERLDSVWWVGVLVSWRAGKVLWGHGVPEACTPLVLRNDS